MTSKTFFRIILVALTFIISGSIYPLYTVIKTSNLFNPCKENPNLIGDGFCDDSANSEKCSFDGGDCCLINVLRDFCVECDCHYQKFQTTETTKSISSSSITTQLITSSTTSTLSSTEFQGCPLTLIAPIVGDGFCNDEANTAGCDFDGGDCCGPLVNTEFCETCECKICPFPNQIGDGICDESNKIEICDFDGGDCLGLENCPFASQSGDGICNDENNNEVCDFDGGDCCGTQVNTAFCNICDCLHIEISPLIHGTNSECLNSHWIGDGFCDDVNNNENCEFDGGDCCGSLVNTEFCDLCECIIGDFCPFPNWIGDGFCDDQNYLEACDYDGGDCNEN